MRLHRGVNRWAALPEQHLHRQPGRQQRGARVGEAVHDGADGGAAELGHGLGDRGQRRFGEAAHVETVEARHVDVVGDAQPPAPQGVQRPERRLVVGADERPRDPPAQQLRDGRVPGVAAEVAPDVLDGRAVQPAASSAANSPRWRSASSGESAGPAT